MKSPSQQIRFCTSRDQVRIAYAICGRGPLLVRAAHWGTHLELDWHSSVCQPWLTALSTTNTLIRYDARGSGLSDRKVTDFSSERHVEDLEAVIEACGLRRFACLA